MIRPTCGMACLGSVLSVLLPRPAASQTPSASEIVAGCARAIAPRGDIGDLRTLRFETRDSGGGRPTSWEIARPNLVRKTREGAFLLVFDGSRAGFLEGPPQDDGTLQGPHLVPEAEWADFELDIALYVPAFFDFPAEYAGITDVDGREAYLLRVVLPLGGTAIYAVDAGSYLPIRVELPTWDFAQRLGDFEEENGFLLPHRYWSPSDSSKATIIENLVVNAELDRDRFRLPATIREIPATPLPPDGSEAIARAVPFLYEEG